MSFFHKKMSPNLWATIMPFRPVTLLFYWPKKYISGQPKAGLISGTGSKPGIDGPWVCPFQNCVQQPHPPFKMAAVF